MRKQQRFGLEFQNNKIAPLSFPVAVIIPTYNRAKVLTRALESVCAQTQPVSEVIVVDDGSTDETEATVSQFLNRLPLKYIRTENQGVSAARNVGISNSRSAWVAFLDSDDEWLPQKIAEQAKALILSPHLKIIHSHEKWVRNGRFVNQMKKHKKSGGRIFEKCLERCLISPSAVMIHREVLNLVGPFREDFPVCEDYDLWLRITSRFEVGYCELPLIVKYGGHEDQLSRRYKAMDHWRVVSMLSVLDSSFISDQERSATKEMIALKSSILLNGYKKHGRTKEAEEIEKTLESFAP